MQRQHKTELYFYFFFPNCLILDFFGWVGFVQTVSRSSKGLHFFPGVDNDGLCCRFRIQAVEQCVPAELLEMGSLSQPRDNSPWHCSIRNVEQESSPSSSGHDLAWKNPKCHSRIKELPQNPLPAWQVPVLAPLLTIWITILSSTSEIHATNFPTSTQNPAKKSRKSHKKSLNVL